MPGVNILDFSKEKDVVKKLKEMTVHGPDVGIESVGCHYNKSLVHTIETAIGMETDTGDVMNEIIKAVRKVRFPSDFQEASNALVSKTQCLKGIPESNATDQIGIFCRVDVSL